MSRMLEKNVKKKRINIKSKETSANKKLLLKVVFNIFRSKCKNCVKKIWKIFLKYQNKAKTHSENIFKRTNKKFWKRTNISGPEKTPTWSIVF